MVPGLLLTGIIAGWRDRLRQSQTIHDFCQAKYGKAPAIFVGSDPARPPADADCPYILIQPGWKTEGTDRKQYRYAVPVQWAIVNPDRTAADGVTELAGIYDCDQLGQLILDEIAQASPANPISYVKYFPLTEEALASGGYSPRFTGAMEVKLYIVPAMGGGLNY
ncbi:hypothetical protein EDC14_1001102 [Hydrogenispora ethanolica]|uniref:Uncharacterized protein n=1 Tax=Hydrogenispora ethanolica TaxID=1082276 RepID=A0A4R1SCR8_HYDET|nr:hypothetical protein [Hydrogenispora ethanolica]TCL76820.1 hypothetical protein EDC14_1001102 [Hydrogenispora ethanolica]